MLHTKFCGNRPSDSGEDFKRVFTIYGHGGHLGHVTQMPSGDLKTYCEPKIILFMLFEENNLSTIKNCSYTSCRHSRNALSSYPVLIDYRNRANLMRGFFADIYRILYWTFYSKNS